VDVRDGRHEADRVDPGRARKSRGRVDERQSGDRGPVETKEIERLVGEIDVCGSAKWGSGGLHLDDDREKSKRAGLHERAQCGVDLRGAIRRLRARGRCRRPERECDQHERPAQRDKLAAPHAGRSRR